MADLDNVDLDELLGSVEAPKEPKKKGKAAKAKPSEPQKAAEQEGVATVDTLESGESVKPVSYAVAKGKAITSRSRGILGPGTVVTAEDCDLDSLVQAGYVVTK